MEKCLAYGAWGVVLVALVTGCIISASPSGESITVQVGKSQEFSIVTNHAEDTFQWYVDEIPQAGETGKSYTYAATPADVGEHTLKVVVSDGSSRLWKIQVVTAGTTWRTTIGGGSQDAAQCVIPSADGGFAVAGLSASSDIPGASLHGKQDAYLAKLDADGKVQWQRLYGGQADDAFFSMQQTADGGYIVAGASQSTVIAETNPHGGYDAYLAKIDALGNLEWQRLYGGADDDEALVVRQTQDGGYILAGSTYSANIAGAPSQGDSDFYIVKTDAQGEVQWERLFGGSLYDAALALCQLQDGGFMTAGKTSNGDKVLQIMLDAGGVLEEQRLFDIYEPRNIQFGTDGGLIATDMHADVMRFDAAGVVQWSTKFGAVTSSMPDKARETPDGGVIAAGRYVDSSAASVSIPVLVPPLECPWPCTIGDWEWQWIPLIWIGEDSLHLRIVKYDSAGNLLWEKSYAVETSSVETCLEQSDDGGYIIACGSTATGDEAGLDIGLFKLDQDGNL